MNFIHHILFDPLSAWEQMKLTLLFFPGLFAFYLIWAFVAGRLWRRKDGK
jgi:hypothetical protein